MLEESPEHVYLPGSPSTASKSHWRGPSSYSSGIWACAAGASPRPTPYYRGLADRPDILALVERLGMSYVRSYGRNSHDYFPARHGNVQPFRY